MNFKVSLFVLFGFAVAAQTYAQAPVITQFAGAKIAFVNTDAFSDPKNGISRLVNVYKKIEVAFKPDQEKLVALGARIETVTKETEDIRAKLNQPGVPVDAQVLQASLAAKLEEGANLRRDFTRMQEDVKQAFEKRQLAEVEPITSEIGKALDAYARSHGIDVVIDASKLADAGALLMMSSSVDITAAFIREYNAKNAPPPVK